MLLAIVVATATGCVGTDTSADGRERRSADRPSAAERPPGPGVSNDRPKPTADEPRPTRAPPAGARAAVVSSITDGDTLHLCVPRRGTVLGSTRDVTVRLLEVDTPETVDPSAPVQCFGPQATRALTRLAPPGSRVQVLADQELTDHYDRTLLCLWSVTDGSSLFVNKAIVHGGYAIASLYEPNDLFIDAVRRAETDSRAADRGLWGACPRFGAPLNPPDTEPRTRPEPPGASRSAATMPSGSAWLARPPHGQVAALEGSA